MRDDIKDALKFLSKEEISMYNKSELARRYGCDPRTINRYLKIQNGEIEELPSRRVYHSKLDDFKGVIINKVDTYGCSARAVYEFIRKKGYEGKYSIVADFIRKHKKEEINKATIGFETIPGLQAQVDWKEDMTLISRQGEIFKINIFLTVLGYSRLKFLKLTSNRNQDTLFNCLTESFKFFGGISKEILFDNMTSVVDINGNSRKINMKMKQFAKDFNFKIKLCKPRHSFTKGKVEALNKFLTWLLPYQGEFFGSSTLANAVLDRLLHHSTIISIKGPSYRIKDIRSLIEAQPSEE